MSIRISLITFFLLVIGTSISVAQHSTTEKEVINTLDNFHQAIIDNDGTTAKKLLSPSAQILEGGNIETKAQYLSHHFHSDGKFLSSMEREVSSRSVTIEGNTAWVSTQTHTWGTYSERELDLNSLELAILKKVEESWKITALHWSSTRRN